MVLIFIIIANGHMMTKFGYYFPWYLFGSACELIAAVLLCEFPGFLNSAHHLTRVEYLDLVKADTSASAIYGYTSLMALGVGSFNQAGYSVVQAKVPKAEIPWALGFMMVCK